MIARSGGFAPDICVKTSHGDRPVYALACCDLVLARSGKLIAVREILLVSPGPQSRLLISAVAFIAGPSKPLRIARRKAVCVRIIEDLLIDLDPLAGDSTIERLDVERDYFDLVLERRVIVLADGLPVESCGDDEPSGLRPLCDSGLILDLIRDPLLMRVGSVGRRLDHTPPLDLHLVADGQRLERSVVGGAHRFLVPAETLALQMNCKAGVPARVAGSGDRRELGACVSKITIDDGFGIPRSIGFAAPGSYRWSRRIAPLAAELWAGCKVWFLLLIDILAPAVAHYRPPS